MKLRRFKESLASDWRKVADDWRRAPRHVRVTAATMPVVIGAVILLSALDVGPIGREVTVPIGALWGVVLAAFLGGYLLLWEAEAARLSEPPRQIGEPDDDLDGSSEEEHA